MIMYPLLKKTNPENRVLLIFKRLIKSTVNILYCTQTKSFRITKIIFTLAASKEIKMISLKSQKKKLKLFYICLLKIRKTINSGK